MELDSKIIYVDMDDVLCQAARHFLVIVERRVREAYYLRAADQLRCRRSVRLGILGT